MPVSIQQQPTTPNVSRADLLYVVTSDETNKSQFNYICDIYTEQELLGGALTQQLRQTRLRQPPSPLGGAVFNLGEIIDDYLEFDTFVLGEAQVDISQSIQNIYVRFGEEYASSISSSVELYDGVTTTASLDVNSNAPAVAANALTILKGVQNTNASINVDLPNGALTDSPATQSIIVEKDETSLLTFLADDISSVTASIPGVTTVSFPITTDETAISIGIGPEQIYQNLLRDPAQGATQAQAWRIAYQDATRSTHYNITAGSSSFRINLDHCEQKYTTKRFHFINDYGVFDSYTATLVDTKRTSVDKRMYTSPHINYNASTRSSNRFVGNNSNTIYNQGKIVFGQIYEESFSIHTDWLDETTSNWLHQLFFSPSVYLEEGTRSNKVFTPVVIGNTDVLSKTNPRGQKLFKYEIQYKLATSKRNI